MTKIYTITAVRLNSDGTASVSLQAADGTASELTVSGAVQIQACYVGRQVQAIWSFV